VLVQPGCRIENLREDPLASFGKREAGGRPGNQASREGRVEIRAPSRTCANRLTTTRTRVGRLVLRLQ